MRFSNLAFSSVLGIVVLASVACASTPQPTSSSAARGPCAPTDCAPCDETKGKCTGPAVCEGHPERMGAVCVRDDDGTCRRKNVCN